MNTSRRAFLKVAGLSAFTLGTATVAGLAAPDATASAAEKAQSPEAMGSKATPGSAAKLATAGPVGPVGPLGTTAGTYKTTPGQLTAGRWAMVIDTRKFTHPMHFERVAQACHQAHNVPSFPGKQEVKWLWKDSFAHVFTDDPHGYMPERLLRGDFLLLCNHCDNPPCVRVCPTQATFKQADGIVVMDPHRCIGCRFCMAGCPFGARSFNFRDPLPYIKDVNPSYPPRTRGVVEKCTFCPERLAVGKLPACVEASEGAIVFGDLNDPASPVRKVLAENFTIRRKPTLGTGPGVYYIL